VSVKAYGVLYHIANLAVFRYLIIILRVPLETAGKIFVKQEPETCRRRAAVVPPSVEMSPSTEPPGAASSLRYRAIASASEENGNDKTGATTSHAAKPKLQSKGYAKKFGPLSERALWPLLILILGIGIGLVLSTVINKSLYHDAADDYTFPDGVARFTDPSDPRFGDHDVRCHCASTGRLALRHGTDSCCF
jgi:hypothetical protein